MPQHMVGNLVDKEEDGTDFYQHSCANCHSCLCGPDHHQNLLNRTTWASSKTAPLTSRREMDSTMASINLLDIVSFDGFDWDDYRASEIRVLQPQLVDRGYSNFVWFDVERDSFGPLIRGLTALSNTGELIDFFYG
jgi:hypothetical protein